MRSTLLSLATLFLAALIVLFLAQRQLTGLWAAVGVRPDVELVVQQSLDDQKRLARLDPEHAAEYRRRFEEREALYRRLEILRMTQREIVRQYEAIMFGLVALTLAIAAAMHLLRRRQELAADRERMRIAENLRSWQEAARRHAHEIRTPLTAAQLELDNLCRDLQQRHPESRDEIAQRQESIEEELDRLRDFTRSFTSFAAVPRPMLVPGDLRAFLNDFVETFASSFPVRFDDAPVPRALFDRALLRQVLVNLCTNSARAGAQMITLSARAAGAFVHLDVADDGKGIDPSIRDRLFEPYTTTRPPGEGMGLGLAISKKILLDHGGDLQLVRSTEAGTLFRLTLQGADA